MQKKLIFRVLRAVRNATPNCFLDIMELKDYIDFVPLRIYFLHDFKNQLKAGGHCHLEEKELLVLLKGSCTAEIDAGDGIQEIEMVPGMAFYVGNYVWHFFRNFSPDAVLLCVASTNYSSDRRDYVSDYGDFRNLIATGVE